MSVSYSFYKYLVHNNQKKPVFFQEHFDFFKSVEGKFTAHRKVDPTPDEYDTFIMRVKAVQISGHNCIVFDVARKISLKIERQYDNKKNDIFFAEVPSKDTEWTHVVIIPKLGVLGIRNHTVGSISHSSGMNRIKSVLKEHAKVDLSFELTSFTNDIEKIVSDLQINKLDFSVRPFNPHPHRLGKKLHDMMDFDGIGKLSGSAVPLKEHIEKGEDGLLSEILGLREQGYGTIGLSGKTNDGIELKLQKPQMSMSKAENLKLLQKSPAIKISIPEDVDEGKEDGFVVDIILGYI